MMPNQLAPVSVVIPHYNAVKELARALESIRAQSTQPKEVIVVDDHSPLSAGRQLDEVCSAYAGEDFTVRLITLPQNCGPGTARNIGWDAAECDYVAFLDADDAWHEDKVRLQYGVMENDPTLEFSCHLFTEGELESDTSGLNARDLKLEPLPLRKWLIANRAPVPTVMVKRSVAERFPANERFSEDYEVWLTMAARKAAMARIRVNLARCFKPEFGHSGLSGHLYGMQIGEFRAIRTALSSRRATQLLVYPIQAWSLIKYIKRRIAVAIRNTD